MSEQIVQDWLVDCAALSPVELHSFASSLKHNDDVINALYDVFDKQEINNDILNNICNQFFTFYRSRELDLQRFTLQFLPSLIYIYLNSIAHGNKKSCSSVETLLIGIYNLEVVDENGQPITISFRLPSLAQASIYHEPMNLAHAALTEAALRRLEECNVKLISWGPLPQVETLNSQNRMKVVTGLMFVFNRHIGCLHKASLQYLCKIASRLASQGFGMFKPGSNLSSAKHHPRIPLSSQLLLEFLSGLYYAMYNGCGYLAMEAVEYIYNRSCFECYAEGVIVANAIKNSSHVTPSGQPSDGPMGISIALSPATTTVTQVISKSMITNASFRTKKLPDDIPIIPKDESGSGGDNKNLTSISEEKEEDGSGLNPRGSSLRGKDAVTKNLQKLGLGKKFKEAKSGKSGSGGKDGTEKRQSLQLSNFKEKVLKSPSVQQNGDGDGVDCHSPHLSTSRKKGSVENGPAVDIGNGGGGIVVGGGKDGLTGYVNEGQVLLTSGGVDPDELDETVICLDSSPSAHKKFDDKPLMQKTTNLVRCWRDPRIKGPAFSATLVDWLAEQQPMHNCDPVGLRGGRVHQTTTSYLLCLSPNMYRPFTFIVGYF